MSAQGAFDFTAARRARDQGMQRAVDAAERHDDAWPDLAYAFLCRYARTHATFEGWHVTDAAKAQGYGSPTSDRAWGSIFTKAQREGVMVQDGAGRNPHRHDSICPRYRSLVFGGTAA